MAVLFTHCHHQFPHAGMMNSFPINAFHLLVDMLVLETSIKSTREHANEVGFDTVMKLFNILPEAYNLVKDAQRVKHVIEVHTLQKCFALRLDGWAHVNRSSFVTVRGDGGEPCESLQC